MLGKTGVGSASSSSELRCQECGNQSKRDCAYSRCRTCCNIRGFQCLTHVRSTWVPTNRRRLNLSPTTDEPKPKRSRAYSSIGGNLILPAEVSFPAVFRCVRVSSMDNVADQFAYQTSVNIAGHVFKGVLYDQGAGHNSGETVGGGDGGGDFQVQLNANNSNVASSPSPGPFGGSVPVTQIFQYSKP